MPELPKAGFARVIRIASAIILLCFAWAGAPASAQQNFNAQQQAEIRAMVREYLVNNPDVLREALEALQTRTDAQRRHRAESDPRDFAIGPSDAAITVVEFFDYRCPYCMAALPWVQDLVQTRHDVRVVFKEMPLSIHGQPALEATQASIAAMPQGRYWQFHQALMSFHGDLTPARIDQLARQSGIDVARMRRAMNDAAITRLINENEGLAADLGATGTPAFLINGHLVSGFDPEGLQARLRQAADEARTRRATTGR
ncbi:MAG: DsbA family protein [Magnetospirillum sp.]|nr:DsbA family protein [Magnetospirillum sp.]